MPYVSHGGPSVAKPVSLAEKAMANPLLWFSLEECAEICGFGKNTMTRIAAAGAPIVGRKCNPHVLREWLAAHAAEVAKDED